MTSETEPADDDLEAVVRAFVTSTLTSFRCALTERHVQRAEDVDSLCATFFARLKSSYLLLAQARGHVSSVAFLGTLLHELAGAERDVCPAVADLLERLSCSMSDLVQASAHCIAADEPNPKPSPAMKTTAPVFIVPMSIAFKMDDEDVTVTAANNGQLGAMLELLKPLLPELMALPPDMAARLAAKADDSFDGDADDGVAAAGPTARDITILLQLLADHIDLPAQLVATGMGWPLAKVRALLPDRFAYLFACLVQVNQDFFVRAMPLLGLTAGMFGALLPAEGQTPSISGHVSSAS